LEMVINGRFTAQPLTGVQRVAHEITQAMDCLLDLPAFRNWHIRLVVPGAASLPYVLRNIDIERTTGGAGNRWEQMVLPRHIGGAILLCLGNSAPIYNLLLHSPMMVMLHDQAYRLFPNDYSIGYRLAHGLVERLILRRSQIILTVSRAESRVLLDTNTIRGRMVVAPNGSWVQNAPVSDRAEVTRADGYGLYIGSFTERKNIGAALATAITLARKHQRRFRFVGSHNALSVAAQASLPEDVRPFISFDGYVADEGLADLYGGADFLLYPSFYEASGLPPSEAMTFGCPVILSDLAVLRERAGTAAIYCNPDDHDAFAAAALRILNEPGLARKMSRLGRRQAATFTWEQQARTILEAARTFPSPVFEHQPGKRVARVRRATAPRPASK
jgi:glycosyltransferase involved in cell wall biosynthesis